MKKVLLMLLAAMAVACAPKDGVRTIRTAADQEADLGKIMEIDGPATFRLVVRNTYADTLFPLRMYTPCGCTQVQFSRDPVAPGADQVLEVTYNPAYRPGPLMETITVYYQASPVQAESFVIKGEVIGYNHPIEEDRPYHFGEGLYMSHKLLLFGVRRPGETTDIFFRHGNGNTKKADIRFDIPAQWQPYVRMRQPGKMKADERDTIHVKFTMPEGIDSVAFDIQPRVNGVPTQEKLAIRAICRK
ncbi:MAG: DUF1573 domain-containing protein [Bacteroidales bacterium]|nr:DUF1573 domain-containing protein [Bacteroidales bacterium]